MSKNAILIPMWQKEWGSEKLSNSPEANKREWVGLVTGEWVGPEQHGIPSVPSSLHLTIFQSGWLLTCSSHVYWAQIRFTFKPHKVKSRTWPWRRSHPRMRENLTCLWRQSYWELQGGVLREWSPDAVKCIPGGTLSSIGCAQEATSLLPVLWSLNAFPTQTNETLYPKAKGASPQHFLKSCSAESVSISRDKWSNDHATIIQIHD